MSAVKTLFALSGNVCAYPRCEEHLTHPGWKQVQGRVCHIKGENTGSTRYDPTQSDEERHGFSNLILLCPNHHNLIDDLEPDAHPVELLLEIKEKALQAHGRDGKWTTDAEVATFAMLALVVYRGGGGGDTVAAEGQVGADVRADAGVGTGTGEAFGGEASHVVTRGPGQTRQGSTAEARFEGAPGTFKLDESALDGGDVLG